MRFTLAELNLVIEALRARVEVLASSDVRGAQQLAARRERRHIEALIQRMQHTELG